MLRGILVDRPLIAMHELRIIFNKLSKSIGKYPIASSEGSYAFCGSTTLVARPFHPKTDYFWRGVKNMPNYLSREVPD
jgi:adenylyl- and sulfurtransferase ThiI